MLYLTLYIILLMVNILYIFMFDKISRITLDILILFYKGDDVILIPQ